MDQPREANETDRNFRLPQELDDELVEVARANDRPVSAEIRRAVRRHVAAELASQKDERTR